jgi:hypothetical protein
LFPSLSVALTQSRGVEVYRYLMNTWNGLPDAYRTRVYQNTLAAVKVRIIDADSTTHDVPIPTAAAVVDPLLLDDFLVSEPPLQQPTIRPRVGRAIMPVDKDEESEPEVELEDEHNGGVGEELVWRGDEDRDDTEGSSNDDAGEDAGEDLLGEEEYEDATQGE